MADDLATALAAERAIVRRAVAGARGIDGGWVVRHPPLPDAWHLNRIHLTGPVGELEPSRLETLASRELAEVPHLRVTVDDAAGADAAWPSLERGGWRRERAVVMVWRGSAPVATRMPRVREIDGAALEAFQEVAFADDAGGSAASAELPARIAATQAALRTGTAWRAFAAGHADGAGAAGAARGAGAVAAAGGAGAALPACSATLYLDPDVGGRRVAFLDQVATLRSHRERGLARAVVTAALRAAAGWEAGLVALFADADDWPQVFYASCGFETVGRQTVFHRSR